jgi:hypothetical protein
LPLAHRRPEGLGVAVSVRIEDEAFADARIVVLGELAGYNAYEALGRMSHLWRYCTQRRAYVAPRAVVSALLGPKGVEAIVGAELGELVDGGVRVRGTTGRIEWLDEVRAGASVGGAIRAATAERDERGRLLPKSQNGDSVHFKPAESSVTSPPSSPRPAQSSSPAPAHVVLVLDAAGDSVDRNVGLAALNKSLEHCWKVSIPPRWYPSYSKLDPFSPAELKAACLAVGKACESNGSKPNPGLLLRKLEDGRRAPPAKSEAREVRERELAAKAKPKARPKREDPPESERFATDGAAHVRDILKGITGGIDSS